MRNTSEEFERVHGVVKHGLNELKPHPLLVKPSEMEVQHSKTLGAMKSVYSYWRTQLEEAENREPKAKAELIKHMVACVNYGQNRGNEHLEAASSKQHDHWAQFVQAHQKGRITPGHSDYNESDARKVHSAYEELPEPEKDKARLMVSFVTNRLLSRANVRVPPQSR